MFDPEHLAKLSEGVKVWNIWMRLNPNFVGANLSGALLSQAKLREAKLRKADLHGANLCGADLGRADLIRANLNGANLRKADLPGAKLYEAKLRGANLSETKLISAKLRGADLSETNLSDTDLRGADLREVDLSRANLRGAELRWADLSHAKLHGAYLGRANLFETVLTGADLSGANLRSANLHKAILDESIVTDIKLWETQRAGWSIKGIVCERAFWDEEAKEPTEYAPGEFERLYSDQTCIELFYQNGVSTFELNTLPALLHHLALLHPETNIRLKSIEGTGGGVKISISVGNADPETTERIKAEAMQVVRAQLVLREDELNREKIEKKYLEKLLFGGLIPAMLTAGTPQNVFNASVTGVVISSGESKVDFNQSVNDNSALLALLEKIMDRRAELDLKIDDASKLENELQSATTELQKKDPDKSVLSKSLETIEEIVKGAMANFVGSAGAITVLDNWQTWLDQLSQLIQHWK